MQHRDALRRAEHHLHIVLGEEQGQAAPAGDAAQQRHRLAGLGGRHAGGGLVEQQDLGLAGQGDAQLKLLLVAVGHRAGDERGLVGQIHVGEQGHRLVAEDVVGARPQVVAAATVGDERGLDVLEDAQLGKYVGALERARDPERAQLVRRQAGDIAPAQVHAAGVGPQVAGEQVEQRGLARAVGADDGRDLVTRYLEADAVDGGHATEGAPQAQGFDHGAAQRCLMRAQSEPSAPAMPPGKTNSSTISTLPSTIGQ